MYKIKTMNTISPLGTDILKNRGCAVGAGVESPDALLRRVLAVPQDATPPDQWEYQILAPILVDHHVILVTDLGDPEAIRRLGLEPAASLAEALASATRRHGPDAPVVVIPDGVSVIITQ